MRKTRTRALLPTLLLMDADATAFFDAFLQQWRDLIEADLCDRMNRNVSQIQPPHGDHRSKWFYDRLRELAGPGMRDVPISFDSIHRLEVRVIESESGPHDHMTHACLFAEIAPAERSKSDVDGTQEVADLGILLRHLFGRSAQQIAEDRQVDGHRRGITRQNVDQRLERAVWRAARRTFVAYVGAGVDATARERAARKRLLAARTDVAAAAREIARLRGRSAVRLTVPEADGLQTLVKSGGAKERPKRLEPLDQL